MTTLDTQKSAARTCLACGEDTAAQMRRCQHCEEPLPAQYFRTCPACGESTPAAGPRCQHCEEPLPGLSPRATANRPVLPQVFAAFALIVGTVSCAGHLTFLLVLQRLADLISPIEQRAIAMPVANRAVAFWDLFVGAFEVSLLVKAAVAGLLVVVSWGLWLRRWWARRVALLWCALVAFTFVVDFVAVSQVESAIARTEMDALRDVMSMASGHIATVASARYASIVDRGASLVMPWFCDHVLYSSNVQVSGLLDTGLVYYLLSVVWFPGFCLLVFGRPSARAYFSSRTAR